MFTPSTRSPAFFWPPDDPKHRPVPRFRTRLRDVILRFHPSGLDETLAAFLARRDDDTSVIVEGPTTALLQARVVLPDHELVEADTGFLRMMVAARSPLKRAAAAWARGRAVFPSRVHATCRFLGG